MPWRPRICHCSLVHEQNAEPFLSPMTVRTLVLMHTESNAGFAIAPLERMFYRIAHQLGDGTSDCVHFAYANLERGYPSNLPDGVPLFDMSGEPRPARERLAEYVHSHGIQLVLAFDMQPVSPLFRGLRRAGVKCILSYWGAEISPRKPWLMRMLKRLQIELSPSKLDGLIFESNAMADLARYGRGVPERMIDIVPLGVDITRFSAVRTEYVYEQFPHTRGRKVVVYAGHMEPRKGVRYLVEAAVQLLLAERRTDVTFLLFGNRPGEEAIFAPLYRHLDVEQHIHFGGYRNDLPQLFSGCYLGVIPSSGWDSFPRTALELAASGLPLIVSDLGGLPETIERGRTGAVVPPADPIALARQIVDLLDDVGRAKIMGRAARARCELHFSDEVQYSRLHAVLRRRAEESGAIPVGSE